MLIGVSPILENIVYSTMRHSVGSTYTIKMKFTQSDSGMEVEPVHVEGINIAQSFGDQMVDSISCRCTFFPKDYINILNNTQDLKVTIIQRRWSRDLYDEVLSEEPDIYQFKVMIANPQDLMKQIPPAVIKQTTEVSHERDQIFQPIPLDMQLIDDLDYTLMKQKGNVALADVDVQGVILYMCNMWGIKNTYISPPDNKQVYQNLIVPPLTGFNELIPWLQKEKGIYNKGAASYFCGGRWYIYPPFDTSPERNEVVNILRLPENSLDGGDTYHILNENGFYLISFSNVSAQSTAQSSTENVGNTVTIRQADSSMDVARDVQNDGTVILNKDSSVIAKVNNSATATANEVNTTYGGTTSNIFDQLSMISAGQMEVIALGWIHAKPWLITPGMKCILHYDDTTKGTGAEDFYSTTAGIVSAASYSLSPTGQPSNRIYKWEAKIALAVPPLESDQKQTTAAQPMTK